jgi:hypothetical protein
MIGCENSENQEPRSRIPPTVLPSPQAIPHHFTALLLHQKDISIYDFEVMDGFRTVLSRGVLFSADEYNQMYFRNTGQTIKLNVRAYVTFCLRI